MNEIVMVALLLAASLFLMGTLFLLGNAVSGRILLSAPRLAEGLSRVVEATKWIRGQDHRADKSLLSTLMPLQVGAGGVGLVVGVILSLAMPFWSGQWFLPLLFGALCYQAPALFLRVGVAARRRAVLRELPELVSVLRVMPHRNVAIALAAVVRRSHGPLAAAIREALERNATGVPLLDAMGEATSKLRAEEFGRFIDVLGRVEASSSRRAELLRTYEQEQLARRREGAMRAVETAEGKISAVLTVATAVQLILLLVIPSLLRFLVPG